jgi:uncharacterized membrane protein YagU involved in acid resistance
MKFSAILLAFSTVVAIVYGVLFSLTYPRVEINGGIVTLCALFGLVTCLAAVGLWKLVTRAKSP